MGHLLDDFVAGAAPITRKGIVAFRLPDWPFGLSKPGPDDIRLGRMLAGPESDDDNISDALEKFDELGMLTEDRKVALETPLNQLLDGSRTRLVPRDQLFSVTLEVSGGATSWCTWWSCTALTSDLAMFAAGNDSGTEPLPLQFWLPPWLIGGITRDRLFQSAAALLYGQAGDWDYISPNGFGLREPSSQGQWGAIRAEGISAPELYRLALVRESIGGEEVLAMDARDLVNFRAAGAIEGFEEFAERYDLELAPRNREVAPEAWG